MESVDSSPSHMIAAKNENYAGGSEHDDIISASSSSCGSAVNGPYVPTSNNSAIKYRTNNNKVLKNVRSLRRRAKSRLFRPSAGTSNDFLDDESQGSPNYLKGTSSSEGKKLNFQASPRHFGSFFNGSEQNSSQSKLFSPSVRNVGILLKKSTSFKPKRSSLNYARVSEDVPVDRATYSSTIKDSKFPKSIEIHPEGKDLEGDSAMKVCRYHHCSLHGHCHGSQDADPPTKRFQYKKRRSLKKQKSRIPNSESPPRNKFPSEKKKKIQKNQMISTVEPVVQETKSGGVFLSGVERNSGMDFYAEIPAETEAQLSEDGHSELQDFDLSEIAFGETSFPERSYEENLNILRKYSLEGQNMGGTASGVYGYCLKCSCSIREQIMPPPVKADIDWSIKQVTASTIGNDYTHEIPQIRDVHVSDARSFVPLKEVKEQDSTPVKDTEAIDEEISQNEGVHKDFPETPVKSDKVTKNDGGFSSASDTQTTSDSNSEGDEEFTNESTTVGNSKESVVQVKDDKKDSPAPEGSKLQFSKQRHISMWHLIHQRMSSDLAAEVVSNPQQGADGEIQRDAANSVPAKENSASEKAFSDSDMEAGKNGSEVQEMELRKLFAIKLVREAIEKILLPEIQDQTSDDQSISGENTPRAELMKENETDACIQENFGESIADKEEAVVPSNPKEESLVAEDTSAPEIMKAGKKGLGISEKKAPKHWSNLKKWILLQRFIRELEKVRKFNPRKPQHLPLNPDPEAEKIRLRAQTLDERKRAEEWMLDYALRQAVSQLAPTQKKKVALLVKAFETVAPSQEDPPIQIRIPRVEGNGLDSSTIGYKVLKAVVEEDGKHKKKVSFDENSKLASDDKGLGSDSVIRERGTNTTGESENALGSNDVCGETLAINQRPSEEILGETKVIEKSIVSSNEEPEESECGNGEPRSTTRNLIFDDNGAEAGDNSGIKDIQGGRTTEFKDTNKAHKTILDREKHFRMWHMIYRHVVTGIAEKVGSNFLDGSDDDDVEENKSLRTNSSDDFSNSNDRSRTESRALRNQEHGFTKSDALKLVKEAVDEILLPEIPDDSSDTQSITSDFEPEQEISERDHSKFGDGISSNEHGLLNNDVMILSGEDRRVESPAGNKSQLPKLKNWRKLKKLILLKRSIRALEKTTKLKPKVHSLVPEMPYSEQEKIDLRHQMTDERNKAEQWMLDYAVQHIVTKLTPARKKRVAMLVEAFEAVVPLPVT